MQRQEYFKEYYIKHKQELNEKHKQYNKDNPDKIKEANKRYQQTEKYKEYKRRYYESNKSSNKEKH